MITPYEGYVEVCEQLAELTPGDHAKKSALFNSGSEAVENAVKIARHATGRTAIVVFDHAYHGRTNLTMALTAKNMPYKHKFGPFAPDIYRVPMSYPFRDGGLSGGAAAAARAIEQIAIQVGADNVAAVLIEPIQGEGGFVVPAEGFLPAVAAWCQDNGVVFIADEIQTGFCRTGSWFACEHEGVVPDLITTAKGIAGGLPLAAVTGRAELMDAVHPGGLGGTYGGNPVACAAALGTIATMRELDLPAAARAIEATMLDPAPRHRGPARGHRRHPRTRRDDRHGAGQARHHRAGRRADRRDRQGLPRRGRRRAHRGYLRQRAALPAAAGDRPGPAQRGPGRARARHRHPG